MKARTITNAFTLIVINLVVLEAASFAAVHALAIASPNRRLDLFLDERLGNASDASFAEFRATAYDPELGWDNAPNRVVTQRNSVGNPWTATYDGSGARRSCLPVALASASLPVIDTFGDSFTRGDEVNDGETWQCEIERRTGRPVANYGVGGYDIGQALLKAERHWRDGTVAPITILGVYAEDLDRVLNRYRPYFDLSSSGIFGFKPSFRYIGGETTLLPNPLDPSITSVSEVRGLALQVAETDYWAQQWARVMPEFPYSLQILRTGRYLVASKVGGSHSTNVWNTQEGREVMLYLLRRFVAHAEQHGTRPVLMLIPELHRWKEGRDVPRYGDFVGGVLVQEGLDLLIVDIAEADFDERQFNVAPFEGHASTYGNRVIASTVLDALGDGLDLDRFDAPLNDLRAL
jgi:hypothetical protein